jgi:hypothetical protein
MLTQFITTASGYGKLSSKLHIYCLGDSNASLRTSAYIHGDA